MGLTIADVSGLQRWWQDWSFAPRYGIAIRVWISIGQWAFHRANAYLSSPPAWFLPPLTVSTPTTFSHPPLFHTRHFFTPATSLHPPQPSNMNSPTTLTVCIEGLGTLVSRLESKTQENTVHSQELIKSFRDHLVGIQVSFFLPCKKKTSDSHLSSPQKLKIGNTPRFQRLAF